MTSRVLATRMSAAATSLTWVTPPVTPSTLILWVGPALFVVLGGLIIILRSRRGNARSELDDDEQQRLAAILKRDGKP